MVSKEKRNILLSAIACSPLLGSEDGVGWHWAIELDRLGHKVVVLTRTRFRDDIEQWLIDNPGSQLKFRYLDVFPGINYNGCPGLMSYAYIHLWQALAVPVAKRIVAEESINLIHHVTFAGIRLPSFLGGLGVPFIFGPVGGGEQTPPALLHAFPFKSRLKERLRNLSNSLVRFDPMMRYTMANATIIALTTKDSVPVIPAEYSKKILISSTIGVESPPAAAQRVRDGGPVVLYAGRFVHWKGMQLGIQAFAQLRAQVPDARLIMVGDGPAAQAWRKLGAECGIADAIVWINWVSQDELVQLYRKADLFLFPSLHDSGGMVVLEAASHGLPILCLDIGGPGEMVGPQVGRQVSTKGLTELQVVADLAQALVSLVSDREALHALGDSARDWAARQTWQDRVSNFYELCNPILINNRFDLCDNSIDAKAG